MTADEILTVDEVAARLKVRPEAVRRWLRDGRLVGFQPGGRKTGWRIRGSALQRFIAAAEHVQDDARAQIGGDVEPVPGDDHDTR
jgi:excisionase family DNA binding protein